MNWNWEFESLLLRRPVAATDGAENRGSGRHCELGLVFCLSQRRLREKLADINQYRTRAKKKKNRG
jgi:hypothetical protein